MKRQDWFFIKNISEKFYNDKNNLQKELCSLPLFILDNNSKLGKEIKFEFEDKYIENRNKTPRQIFNILKLNEFLFLNQIKNYIFRNLYSSVRIDYKNNAIEFTIMVIEDFSQKEEDHKFSITLYRSRIMVLDNDKIEFSSFIAKDFESNYSTPDNIIYSGSKKEDFNSIEEYKDNMSDLNLFDRCSYINYGTLLEVIDRLEFSNNFIFTKANKSNNKERNKPIAKDKKPWARGDLSSIVFLNKFPISTQKGNSKGGTHASPHYHFRKGSWRKLSHIKYKNHPKFGKKIWIRPILVGEKETVVNGITYKVL